jgi:hypothetical protein
MRPLWAALHCLLAAPLLGAFELLTWGRWAPAPALDFYVWTSGKAGYWG